MTRKLSSLEALEPDVAILSEAVAPEREAPLLDWRRIFVRGFAFGGLAGAAVMILLVVGLGPLGHRLWPSKPHTANTSWTVLAS